LRSHTDTIALITETTEDLKEERNAIMIKAVDIIRTIKIDTIANLKHLTIEKHM